jgi:DNA-directed RNA polymerase subunit RPC12/RpoP
VTEGSCPTCGEPVDRRQLVCLNCGARVALRERTSWAREPVTALAAALLVLVVVGAGLFGFAISELTSDDGGEPTRAAAESTAQAPAGEGPAVVSGGEQTARTAEEPAAGEPAPDEPGAGERGTGEPGAGERGAEEPQHSRGSDPLEGSDRVPGWPAGLSAHTVVLVNSSDRAAALNVARQARASGLEAGLMRSEPYDLGTGLWIVFSGQFTTPEGAERQAAQLEDRYPGAYPQRIQRSQ